MLYIVECGMRKYGKRKDSFVPPDNKNNKKTVLWEVGYTGTHETYNKHYNKPLQKSFAPVLH